MPRPFNALQGGATVPDLIIHKLSARSTSGAIVTDNPLVQAQHMELSTFVATLARTIVLFQNAQQ
jgi:hypothetical protein